MWFLLQTIKRIWAGFLLSVWTKPNYVGQKEEINSQSNLLSDRRNRYLMIFQLNVIWLGSMRDIEVVESFLIFDSYFVPKIRRFTSRRWNIYILVSSVITNSKKDHPESVSLLSHILRGQFSVCSPALISLEGKVCVCVCVCVCLEEPIDVIGSKLIFQHYLISPEGRDLSLKLS